MERVKALLPRIKPAEHLCILADVPVSTGEKLLSGQRDESAETLIQLLRSPLGREVLFAALGKNPPEWARRYQKQLDVNDARRRLAETQRLIERLQNEASEV